MSVTRFAFAIFVVLPGSVGWAQEVAVTDPASLAFEEGRWEDVIVEYRVILAASPEDRLSPLRIAQAERELGRYEAALATLEQAHAAQAPEAMIELERARNFVGLGRSDDAFVALEASDEIGLRALTLLEESDDFAALRETDRFQRVYRHVRERVFPCEAMDAADDFDFWLGRWEVRMPDGTLVGHNTITKRDGGCSIHEQWEGAGGATGTSVSFYLPSRGQWRQVWVGSAATLFDITGGLVDGEMQMEGIIEYAHQDRVVAFRGSWTEASDGRVRQRFEEFDLAGNRWQLWFDGFYSRIGGP